MPMQFSTPGRRTVRRRHVNHRKPTTIRERLIAGLECMGYEKIPARTSRYEVYKRDDKNWYVGDGGALRIGTSVVDSHAAGDLTRELILTAPVIRPLVRNWLEEHVPSGMRNELDDLVAVITNNNPDLTGIDARLIKRHITQWRLNPTKV